MVVFFGETGLAWGVTGIGGLFDQSFFRQRGPGAARKLTGKDEVLQVRRLFRTRPRVVPARGEGIICFVRNTRPPQKNAKARISMLSRGFASGGLVGSSNAVWAV